MGRITLVFLLLLPVAGGVSAGETVLVVDDADGAGARVGAPVCATIDLTKLREGLAADCIGLVELSGEGQHAAEPIPAQFVKDTDSTIGTLWWLMPVGAAGQRRFRIVEREPSAQPLLHTRLDEEGKAVDVCEGDRAVLRYNHGTVPPPPEIVEHYETKRKPPQYYARGDYIHPVFGPNGESLTDDYSLDHPHHRGICWAWPVVRWKGESRDLWAVRVLPEEPGGVWARPVSIDRLVAGPVLAIVEAQNIWKWGDAEPIVEEHVTIRAFRERERCRFVDIEVRLTALVDELSIGGRPGAGYGGFTFRTYPEFDGRNIDMHVGPADRSPREAWFHLTGNFPGGKGPAGVLLMEHVRNSDYPSHPDPQTSDAVPGRYPRWRTVQPAWPGDREVPLAKDQPLVLKHRLWIHPGLSDGETLADVWKTYAGAVFASLQTSE